VDSSDVDGREFTELLKAEEAKRERNWDAAERWRVIQATITWADSQRTGGRNTKASCLEEQARKLTWFASQE
jgi:hypothetical protein